MTRVLDSVSAPSAGQIAAAKAAGWEAWLGGFSGPNILYNWADTDFQRVLAGGLLTGAYCSRLMDPAVAKARAAALGIVIIEDDEPGIAAFDVAATDTFLGISGGRLYGGSAVMTAHIGHAHPGYVIAAYPGGAQTATWPSGVARPPQPVGWQYLGTQSTPFGVVDMSNFEAAVLGGGAMCDQILRDPDDGSEYAMPEGTHLDAAQAAALTAAGVPMVTSLDGADVAALLTDSNANSRATILAALAKLTAGVPGPAGPAGPAGPQGAPGVTPTTAVITGTAKLS